MRVNFYAVIALPEPLEPNSFYYVDNGAVAESYLTDSTGNAKSVGNTVMINQLVAAALAGWEKTSNSMPIVVDIAARDALILTLEKNSFILVLDASADPTVESGSALYAYDFETATVHKIAEYESMDLIIRWTDIQGRPESTSEQIDSTVGKAHTHSNKTVIDDLSDDAGVLQYKGLPISGGGSDSALRDDLSDAHNENKGASLVAFRGETVRSSLVRRSQFYESGSTDILIIIGQSNAAGYAAMSDGAPTYLTDLAQMWDGTKLIPITAYTPTPYLTSTGSAWAAFANEYCDNTGRRLVIVNCAQGSRSIADLQKGGANYSNMIAWVDGVKSAINDSGGVVARVLVAFNQGQQDYTIGTTYAVYMQSLEALWSDIKTDTGAERFGIFTVGLPPTSAIIKAQSIQKAQIKFARANQDCFIAYDGLSGFSISNGLKIDAAHYSQRGYNIMGREGGKTFSDVVLRDSGSQSSEPQVKKYGSIDVQGGQQWNMHAAIVQKTSTGWSLATALQRNSSYISGVDTSNATTLKILLSCPATTVLSFAANFGGSRGLNNLRPVVGVGNASTNWPANSDGVSEVPVNFYIDLSLKIDMINQTVDNTVMGSGELSTAGSISVAWDGEGMFSVTHPSAMAGYPSTMIEGVNPRIVTVEKKTSTLTKFHVRSISGDYSNDVVYLTLKNLQVKQDQVPFNSMLSLSIIAADYEFP